MFLATNNTENGYKSFTKCSLINSILRVKTTGLSSLRWHHHFVRFRSLYWGLGNMAKVIVQLDSNKLNIKVRALLLPNTDPVRGHCIGFVQSCYFTTSVWQAFAAQQMQCQALFFYKWSLPLSTLVTLTTSQEFGTGFSTVTQCLFSNGLHTHAWTCKF